MSVALIPRFHKEGLLMALGVEANGVWYHGSPSRFTTLLAGSTITQWRQLAEAFAHKPTLLGIDDDGTITHNGCQPGFLYVIDEAVQIGADVYPHPRTTMEANAEFLTAKPLKVRLIAELPCESDDTV